MKWATVLKWYLSPPTQESRELGTRILLQSRRDHGKGGGGSPHPYFLYTPWGYLQPRKHVINADLGPDPEIGLGVCHVDLDPVFSGGPGGDFLNPQAGFRKHCRDPEKAGWTHPPDVGTLAVPCLSKKCHSHACFCFHNQDVAPSRRPRESPLPGRSEKGALHWLPERART